MAALATIETIEKENLLERAVIIGNRFKNKFESWKEKCSLITDIRISGAMIGLELSEDATHIVQKCLDQKLLINCTHNTVIRLLPALNITDAEIDEGCEILEKIILG